jgi:hypothetical protein
MKRLIVVFLLAQVLIGCASRYDGNTVSLVQLAHENQTNVNKLTVGMSKSAVVDLMGTKTAKTGDGLVSNPFRSETFQDKAGTRYEVLYYTTEKNRSFQPLRLAQTTPLILKNDALIGWGTESLRRAKELMTKEININIDR